MKNNTRSWNKVLALVMASAGLCGLRVSGQVPEVAYSNTQNYEGSFYQSQNEFGDQIWLTGTPNNQVLQTLKVEYYLSHNASGNEQAIIDVCANDGASGAPGTLLYNGASNPISLIKGNDNTMVVDAINVGVPTSITYTVQFTGVETGEQIGLVFYGTPEIGASTDDIWEKINGVWTTERFGPDTIANFGSLAMTVVPEPTTLVYGLLAGVAWLGGRIYRRRS